ncbi:Peptidase family M48 family protein [Perilla frutescens var. hirtella]|uniref:Peptidase family M48 family protein n=1 Tax=Perilla frutescens var. hirtella TaxID=608512 RepID=A0AAD4J6V8_PERFH|nr:Peptidase family M48 family protein [Perilla frutescens var. hirtella]
MMGWYRRPSRFILDAYRHYNSKIAVPRSPPIQESVRTFSLRPYSSGPRSSQFSQPIFRNSVLQNVGNNNQRYSPFLDGAKRFYYVDGKKVRHFKPRGYKRWSQNPKYLISIVLIGSGVVITIYSGNLETVPYTKRTHFVLLSNALEKDLGEREFKKLKAQFKGKILPPLHPESIRVQKISQEIIEALQKGLRKEQVWTDVGYSPENVMLHHHEAQELDTVSDNIIEEEKWIAEDKWHKEDEILNDQWIQQSRKKGQEKGVKSETQHLEGFKWEVIVVNEPIVNAFCLPGGKIVVFTGLLNHFKADAEIATIIGHEVSHAVARHSAEQISKNLWLAILQLILYQFFMPDVVNTMSNLFLRLPFSRRMEMEADYIGLLLIASAGYDPRVAPQVYEKLGRVAGSSPLQDYLATHPSGKKRAQLLSQAKVMEEALSIYREAQAGRGIEGFL